MFTKRILTLTAILALAAPALAVSVWSHDFETPGGYSTSVTEFSDDDYDYFLRTEGSDIGSGVVFTNQDGYFFGAQDLDGEGASLPLTLDFSIDITGYTGLSFTGLFAEDDDGTSEDWDDADYLHVRYQIDGGGYQELLWFESELASGSNGKPLVDNDFDGTGDGTEITDTFQTLTAGIAGTGSTLDLQFEFDLNAGDEDIAIDNLEITGEEVTGSEIPEPMTMFAGLIGLAATGRYLRKNR